MNFKAYSILVGRQLKQKLGRFLIASGGIAVGIWAITLTNGLSSGLQQTVITAINSQPFAKEFNIIKAKEGSVNLFSQQSPEFLPLPESTILEIKKNNPEIDFIIAEKTLSLNLVTQPQDLEQCDTRPGKVKTFTFDQVESTNDDIPSKCKEVFVSANDLAKVYKNNQNQWVGKQPSDFGANEIALCFDCGDDYYTQLGVTEPQQLIGKTLLLEYISAPQFYELNQVVQFSQGSVGDPKTTKSAVPSSVVESVVIAGVIDDREAAAFSLVSGSYWLPNSYFEKAFALANPGQQSSSYGSIAFAGSVKDFAKLKSVIADLEKQGYSVLAPGASLVDGIDALFLGLSVVLTAFGLIALLASVFGIISIMTISVLERQKEIGILKALGATNNSIFLLFLLESAMLGILGWAIGTLTAVGIGFGIAKGATWFIAQNPDIQKNLAQFDINQFNPSFSLTLLASTFGLAVIVTALSGVLPARRAAMQRPADIMRSE